MKVVWPESCAPLTVVYQVAIPTAAHAHTNWVNCSNTCVPSPIHDYAQRRAFGPGRWIKMRRLSHKLNMVITVKGPSRLIANLLTYNSHLTIVLDV